MSGTDVGKLARLRRTVLRRGLFLLVIGFVNLTFFEGDILRVYGVSLMMAAVLIDASGRRLLAAAGAFVAGFLLLLAVFDYEAHWDWDTMYYDGQWTPAGIVRHLFYDGFRSVFPWTGLLIFGIWLGRRDWRDRRTNTRILGASALVMLATEVGSWLAVRAALKRWPQADPETVTALVGTESMPPLPLFLLAAGGTAVLVIALCVRVSLWRGMPALLSPLVATGQLALTWYFAHIVIGLGTVKTLGWEASFPLTTSVATGLLFFAVAVVLSWVWKRRFRLGPLEATMRWMTG